MTDVANAPLSVLPVTTEGLLSVEGARVRFGSLLAVNNVSFALNGGDLLGLIGPNGAGKTTLLRLIAGLQPLSAGRVTILGQSIARHDPDALRQIGFTSDTPPCYEDMTVRDFLRFIALGYDLHGPAVEESIDFWLEKVWLTEKADQKIKQLSRGMRQRIGIARTLLPNPSVILLDEPAAGLDPVGRVQFRQLLCDLREQGKALIVSSHILSDLSEYCTHIGIMAQGSMVQFGTVAAVAGQADAARCRYTIALARPMPSIEALLREQPGLDTLETDRDKCMFNYHSDRENAAQLLATLIQRGVPIAAFSPDAHDLEAVYLRTGIRQVD